MKINFAKLFEPYTDPVSGITVYILSKKAAPVQQSFYYINTTISPDNRYLWFYCAFPPAGSREYGRTLGVADLQKMTVTQFPETLFDNASPVIDPATGGVYWCTREALCYRSPDPTCKAEVIAVLPDELYGRRLIRRIATHLTFSPDRSELFLDSLAGDTSFGGTISLSTRQLTVWKTFPRDLKHAQFSPTNKNLVMVAQDNYHHPLTGEHFGYDNRVWFVSRDGALRPLFENSTRLTHEWWDSDGEHIYAVNNFDLFGGPGIVRIDIESGSAENVLPGMYWHAMNYHDKYFACDRTLKGFYRGCPSSIHFFNRKTGKDVAVISHNPEHHTPPAMYHIDPHPHFSEDGSLFIFTTTVRGQVDVAIAPVEELVKKTE
ncbi:MAG: hypothetical protein JW904_06015 [Spirochaetales bacterium]|nr:hypothetical protein [Spirochaetales bacterium]